MKDRRSLPGRKYGWNMDLLVSKHSLKSLFDKSVEYGKATYADKAAKYEPLWVPN